MCVCVCVCTLRLLLRPLRLPSAASTSKRIVMPINILHCLRYMRLWWSGAICEKCLLRAACVCNACVSFLSSLLRFFFFAIVTWTRSRALTHHTLAYTMIFRITFFLWLFFKFIRWPIVQRSGASYKATVMPLLSKPNTFSQWIRWSDLLHGPTDPHIKFNLIKRRSRNQSTACAPIVSCAIK